MASLFSLTPKIFIAIIRVYQIILSPLIAPCCRFYPTCSQYGIEVIKKFGIFKGCWLIINRILKCHPLNFNVNIYDLKYFKYKNTNNQRLFNMNARRNFFIVSLVILSCIIWQTWNEEYNANNRKIDKKIHQNTYENKNSTNNQKSNIIDVNNKDKTKNIITISTDVLSLKINIYDGNIEDAYLLNYLEKLNTKQPFHLLQITPQYVYQAISTISINNINQNAPNQLIFHTKNNNKNYYTLKNNQETITIPLYYHNNDITYIKTYTINKGSYAVEINHEIYNHTKQTLKIMSLGELKQSIDCPKKHKNNNFFLSTYHGTAYYTEQNKYQKYSIKDIKNKNLNVLSQKEGWIAMLQQYFIVALIPITIENNTFYTNNLNNFQATINFKSKELEILPKQQKTIKNLLWIGPKIQEQMTKVNPHLDLVIDYGWLWFISHPLFKLLHFIYNYVGNWGFSIILITLIIRIIMYPLTKAQYTSITKLREIQPKLLSIQTKYKNNKQRYHQEIMTLYKKEKVNPLGGCLPLIIQMPIFLALYYMLSGSVELRHAKFILWINDLSSQDPYYILPILMGMTMFYIQKTSPTSITDKLQKKITNIMLMIFTIFFLWFPSGLVLYYIISNVITIIQQQIIYRELKKYKKQ